LKAAYRDILKHSGIYGLGQILRRLASFLLLPFYTSYLSPAEYGCIAILDLTAAVLGVVIGSGLASAVTRYHFEARNETERNRVWWTGLTILGAVASTVVALVWMLRTPLARLTLGPNEIDGSYYYQFILMSLWFEAIGQILDSYVRVRKWSATFVGSSLLCLLLNIGLNVYFLGTLRLGVAGLLLGNLLACGLWRVFLLTLFVSSSSWNGLDTSLAFRLLQFGSPLVVLALMSLIMHQGDRYLLRLLVGLDQVGIYSLAYSMGQAIHTLVFLPFSSIWGVVIYEIAEQPHAKKMYALIFQYFVYCQMLLFLGVALFAKPLLALMAAPAFAEAGGIIPIVCLAYLLFSLHEHFKVPALLAKRTLTLLPGVVTAAAANIGANLLLIPLLGPWGAAWSSVLTFAIFSFLGLWRYRLIDKYEYPLLRCGAVLLGMIAAYLSCRLLEFGGLSSFWLFAFSSLIWCSWALLLLGGVLSRFTRPGAWKLQPEGEVCMPLSDSSEPNYKSHLHTSRMRNST
jgi:O-antigen/teichoic acid export membrane protein